VCSSDLGKFTTELGWNVKVDISKIPTDLYNELSISIKKQNIANVAYKVEGVDTHYKNSNYKTLIRILKTVLDIVIEYINQNKNIEALLFFSTNKNPDFALDKTDRQKDAIYRAITIKTISKLGQRWRIKDIELGSIDFTGFMVYKTKSDE